MTTRRGEHDGRRASTRTIALIACTAFGSLAVITAWQVDAMTARSLRAARARLADLESRIAESPWATGGDEHCVTADELVGARGVVASRAGIRTRIARAVRCDVSTNIRQCAAGLCDRVTYIDAQAGAPMGAEADDPECFAVTLDTVLALRAVSDGASGERISRRMDAAVEDLVACAPPPIEDLEHARALLGVIATRGGPPLSRLVDIAVARELRWRIDAATPQSHWLQRSTHLDEMVERGFEISRLAHRCDGAAEADCELTAQSLPVAENECPDCFGEVQRAIIEWRAIHAALHAAVALIDDVGHERTGTAGASARMHVH